MCMCVCRWRLEGEGVVDRGRMEGEGRGWWAEGGWKGRGRGGRQRMVGRGGVVHWDLSNSDVISPCLFISHVAQPCDTVTARRR